MAYVFCSPKKGKGSVFIYVPKTPEGSEIYTSLHQEYYSKGISVVLYNMIPIRKSSSGDFYGNSSLLPTKEIKSEAELRNILDQVTPDFDFEKFFDGKPQKQHEDLLFDTSNGFLAEHTISNAEKEMIDEIKTWKEG